MQKLRRRDTQLGSRQAQHGSNRQRSHRQILNRGSEPERGYFRAGRYFTVGHEWYAATREGQDIGPCATRHQIELTLARYLADRVLDNPGQIGLLVTHSDREMTELEVQIQEFTNCRQHALLRSANSAYVWAQQRLDKFEEHSAEHDHAVIRAKVLRHFLAELE